MMYYIRVIFAVIGGVLTGALNIRGELGLVVGVAIFLGTYALFKYGIKRFRNVPEKNKLYMTGIFSFFLIWFVFWVISINLIYPAPLP